MSAAGVTDALVEAIDRDRYDFIVANFANPDMVGHTGVWEATVGRSRRVDACLGRVVDAHRAPSMRGDPGGPGALLCDHRRPRQRRRAARRRPATR